MILGNNEPHQVYVQFNALDLSVCGPEATGIPCLHEWAIVRLCDKLARPNMVSNPTVVPGMIWLTCEGSVGNTSHVRQDTTSIKLWKVDLHIYCVS